MKKLKLIMAAFALLLGWSNAMAYQTPVADGIYYLYNTGVTDGGSGFICRGEDYAQRAVIDKYGIPFKLISTGETDTYYFQAYDTDLWLSDDGFMYTDGGTDRRRAIKVELQSDGIYKLINTNNSKEVENWYGHPVGDGEGNRRDYLWQFLSVAEYEAVVAGYTTTEKSNIATSMSWDLSGTTFDSYLSANYIGIDKTSLIQHATFDTTHETDGWTVTANAHSSMAIAWGNESGEKITPEVYQGYGTISQTVTVENAGLYKVSVNAFARNNNYTRFHEAGAVSSVSYLMANDNKVRLCDIYSNGEVTSDFPGGPNAANNNFFSKGNYLNEVYVYVGDSKQITITLCNPSSTAACWMVFNNFKLTYYSDQVSDEDATAILTTATSTESEIMNADVKTALTSAKTTFDASKTIANYNALNTAISNANASISTYEAALSILDAASSLDVAGKASYAANETVAAIQSAYSVRTLESISSDQQTACATALRTAAKAQTTEGADMTLAIVNYNINGNANGWTIEKSVNGNGPMLGTTSFEYWSYTAGEGGFDYYQTITDLPAGIYTISADMHNDQVDKEGDDFAPAAGVYGTSGSTTVYGLVTEQGSTLKEYTSDQIFVANGTLRLGVKNKTTAMPARWFVADNFKLTYVRAATAADYKVNLLTAINNATDARKTSNEGTGVFQIPAAAGSTLATAISTAQSVYDNLSATISEVTTAISDITNAKTTYEGTALNAPDADKRYVLTIVEDGKTWDGNAITFIAGGRADMGGYGIKYLAPANANMNQALKFTAVDGYTNTYKISAINVENGAERYITTGSTYTGNNSQIRTTDDASKASWVKIQATATAGQFQLLNVSDGNKVIANNNNNDMYTANSANFTIAEASQASVSVNIDANKWATRIFPVAPGTIEGITFYSCDAIEGDKVTLEEVATPEANKPYILRSSQAVNTSVSGWGTAGATSYTEGYLTGVYDTQKIAASVAATAEADGAYRYVLQTQDAVQAFYKVDAEFTATANRVFLTVPQAKTGGEVKALFFDFGDETGITETTEKTEGSEAMFDLSGRRVSKAQKGLYIVNGKKVMVK